MAYVNNLPTVFRALDERERKFVYQYVSCGNGETAKSLSGYADGVQGSYLLRRPTIMAAIRFEVARLLATEGAQVGYGCLKRIAQDTAAPAAAQVSAAKALLQAAGLLDAPNKSGETKALTAYSQAELRDYMEQKKGEIEQMESALAGRATDVTPNVDTQPVDPFA
jgi:phage terminase small subunit